MPPTRRSRATARRCRRPRLEFGRATTGRGDRMPARPRPPQGRRTGGRTDGQRSAHVATRFRLSQFAGQTVVSRQLQSSSFYTLLCDVTRPQRAAQSQCYFRPTSGDIITGTNSPSTASTYSSSYDHYNITEIFLHETRYVLERISYHFLSWCLSVCLAQPHTYPSPH